MNTINERVKNIIEALNISANAFAQELEVAGSVVYNILKGRNKPSFDILDKIVSSFNVNPTYLLIGDGNMFMSNDETQKIDNQRTGNTDKDYTRFLKQWDKINSIVEINGRGESHNYYSGLSAVLSGLATVTEHYSLMNQSIAFLRFAPQKIDNNTLSEQVMKMLEFEEEIISIVKPYEKALAKLSKEIEAFNERHDNVGCFDDDYFENILKEVDNEMNPPLS